MASTSEEPSGRSASGRRVAKGRQTAMELHSQLREMIVQGLLAPGTELNQASLARSFDVSRIPMREAFRMLQQEGFIHAEPNMRAVVASFDVGEQETVWAALLMLETLAIQVSVELLTKDQIAELDEILHQMQIGFEHGDATLDIEAHRQFHSLACVHAGVEINNLIQSLTDKTTSFLAVHGRAFPHSTEQSLDSHVAILDAIKLGDRDAASQATAHHIAWPAITHLSRFAPASNLRALSTALTLLSVSPDGLPDGFSER